MTTINKTRSALAVLIAVLGVAGNGTNCAISYYAPSGLQWWQLALFIFTILCLLAVLAMLWIAHNRTHT
jgi:hypothetical protein